MLKYITIFSLFITFYSNSQNRPVNTQSVIQLANRVANLTEDRASRLTQEELKQLHSKLSSALNILNFNSQTVGFCDELDSRYIATFKAIKEFAYASEGLNYNSQSAVDFASSWTKNNDCNELEEFKKTIIRLKAFAYDTNGLNYNSSDAVKYALEKEPSFCSNYNLEQEFTKLYNFAYSHTGLNYNTNDARLYAQTRVEPVAFRCIGWK
jgi:hypothetical protein